MDLSFEPVDPSIDSVTTIQLFIITQNKRSSSKLNKNVADVCEVKKSKFSEENSRDAM